MSATTFSDNTAPSCGAVAVRSARTALFRDSQFLLNRATGADRGSSGGAVCFGPPPQATSLQPPPPSHSSVCVSGEVVALTAPSGTISPVAPGQLLPAARMNCTWVLSSAPPESEDALPAGCTVVLAFAPETAGAMPRSGFVELTDVTTVRPPSLLQNDRRFVSLAC